MAGLIVGIVVGAIIEWKLQLAGKAVTWVVGLFKR